MDKIDLDRLKELAQRATPGSWEHISQCGIEEVEDSNHFTMASVDDHDNASYIAAASPDVVLALIAEIEELRAKANAQTWACGECNEVANELKDRMKNLEKEADWLAEHGQGIDMCPFLAFQYGDGKPVPDWCEGSETAEDGFECPKDEPVECWRTAARKAVEGKENGN